MTSVTQWPVVLCGGRDTNKVTSRALKEEEGRRGGRWWRPSWHLVLSFSLILTTLTLSRPDVPVPLWPGNTPMLFTKLCPIKKTRQNSFFRLVFGVSRIIITRRLKWHKRTFHTTLFSARIFEMKKTSAELPDVYVRRWADRGVTQMTYIYVVGRQRVN